MTSLLLAHFFSDLWTLARSDYELIMPESFYLYYNLINPVDIIW